MSLQTDSAHAAEILERLQAKLIEQGDKSQNDELSSLVCMLDSPVFRQLLNLQESLQELNHITSSRQITTEDFDFSPTGELLINETLNDMPDGDFISPSNYVSVSAVPNQSSYPGPGGAISTHKYNIEFQRAVEKAAQGREVETIQLTKEDNVGLGFSVVGLKSENQGELGIFVQGLQPGGIAARDGRLREGDQILAIDGQPLDISHQQAIGILQSASGLVEIVVARGAIPASDQSGSDTTEQSRTGPAENSTDMVLNTEWTQIEVIDLTNDGSGLGFGIIGGRSTGVVVKTILPGGVADNDGRLRSGDHILQIGDVNVRGMSSEQVASVLRQSGSQVRLVVARAVMEPSAIPIPHAPIIPTNQLDEQLQNLFSSDSQEQLELTGLTDDQINQLHSSGGIPPGFLGDVEVYPPPQDLGPDSPEVEFFDAELMKDSQGLGITIAGYVGGEKSPEELSGIFVKSVAEGSAAALDGRIQVNDQIIEVDGQSLQGFTNHQAVDVLRNTGQVVHLKLVRYRHGPKYEQLQQYHAQANQLTSNSLSGSQPTILQNGTTEDFSIFTSQVYNAINKPVALENINLYTDEDYSGELLPDVEAAIKACWEPIVGDDFEVIVAQLSKFQQGGGLGISLEGTVDVENGVEVRPHHYIRSILPQGPVGLNGRLQSGDELLEVNGKRLLGLNHVEVVCILKELPQHVRIVCARRKRPVTENYAQKDDQFFASSFYTGVQASSAPMYDRLVKSKSEMALSSPDHTAVQNSLNKMKSRSLEPLTGLAMWSSDPVVIELTKGDKGLGFSILDYQDPMNPSETVIVIRSLVPGGVAQQDGRLVPGDRLIFVNDVNLENATLDQAVQALKGAVKGIVRIGVAKPLPIPESVHENPEEDVSSPPPVAPPPPIPLEDNKAFTAMRTEEEIQVNLASHFIHRKTESMDSSVSSSSDHITTSDLKAVSSPSSTPRTLSPGMSPLASPSLMRAWSGSPNALPASLERTIKIKKGNDQLGMTVEAIEKGINGCVVKTLTKGGAVTKDGHLQTGDYIVHINNETMRRITNAQARAILRRASLLSTDISITYVTAADVITHRETCSLEARDLSPTPHTIMTSPNSPLTSSWQKDSPLSSPTTPGDSLASSTTENSPIAPPAKETMLNMSQSPQSPPPPLPVTSPPPVIPPPPVSSPRQKSLAADGSPAISEQTWGPARVVELEREAGKSLGISIVGGRVDLFHVAQENAISGIFIKHVLEDSPAGRNGTLKTGDRILEVDGVDLRDATHDQAVEVIRKANNPVKFVVQNLVDSSCPRDLLEADSKSVQSYDEGPAAAAQGGEASGAQLTMQEGERLAAADTGQEAGSSDTEQEDEFGYSMKRLQRTYGDLNGELHVVELSRSSNGLGISLAGNKDRSTMSVFVAGIQPESAAARDGRIQVGDELLEVNGQVLYGRSHLNASAIIKGLTTPVVKIVILRREDFLDQMAVKPLKLVPILPTEVVDRRSSKVAIPEPSSEDGSSPTPEISIRKASQVNAPGALNIVTADSQVKTVLLEKSATGLGFAICEGTDDGKPGIFVKNVTPAGVAAEEGSLHVGDQILEVDDTSLIGVHYDKAIETLRRTHGTVKLTVSKRGTATESSTPSSVIQFNAIPGESSTDSAVEPSRTESPPSNPITCAIVPGRETNIEIEKGRTGLGLSIVGGADTLLGAIIVHEVYEDGAAARDNRLHPGDQIIEVNHEDLRDVTHDRAIQVLRQTPSVVHMLVLRDDNQMKEEELYDIFTVELMKKPGKGLGISIVGKRNDVGVYISDVVKSGVAEADGRLMQGDQILAVNGEEFRNATQDYAAAVLKTLMGKVSLTIGRLKAGSKASSRRNSGAGTGLRKSESSASNKSKGKHSKAQSEDMSTSANTLRSVLIERDESGSLGLSIAGGIGSPLGDVPIMVANLNPTGPAVRSQKLKVGDHILSINGESTESMTLDKAVQCLKNAPGPITLRVTQGEERVVSVSSHSSRQVSMDANNMPSFDPTTAGETADESAEPQYKTIILQRGADGLGFSIVGGHGSPHGDLPIYVKNVFSKGAASEDGTLKRGDQILAVNGRTLEGMTHEEAVTILKQATGTVTLLVLS